MKKAMVATAVALTLAFTGGVALASSCPKVKGAVAKLDEAQKLHDGGKHSESMAKANEALADLGVKK